MRNRESYEPNKISQFYFISIYMILFFSPFFFGLYKEYCSCIMSIVMVFLLWMGIKRMGKLKININIPAITAFVISSFYVISRICAVDTGMAFIGFAKFLPLPLFSILIMQCSQQQRDHILNVIPVSGGVMVLTSFILSLVPELSNFVIVNNRLAGFFQYPNTFALFLLLGIVILTFKKTWKLKDWIMCIVLIFGLYQSGSRAIFGVTWPAVPPPVKTIFFIYLETSSLSIL